MEGISGDVFSVSLGNILPDSEINISIKYIGELGTEIDCTKLRLILPLTIMPRYGSGKKSHHKQVNPEKINSRPYNMSITGSILMTDGLLNVQCKTHQIDLTNKDASSINFGITDLGNLNEDVVITIERNKPQSTCLIQTAYDLTLKNAIYRNAAMINIIPIYDIIPKTNTNSPHYIIIIDFVRNQVTSSVM